MAETTPQRPLSPHLQVYKPMLTMTISIIHRLTGCALYFGMALFAIWLLAAASGADAYGTVQAIYGSWLGLLILVGFTWALVHHLLGGLRHLIWDTGRGFDLEKVELMAKLNLGGSVVITVLLWIIALAAG
ncbi:MAG: succinate dehydrogenase, cytochrome b556 subunit [Hyphomicrobiales bacterium]